MAIETRLRTHGRNQCNETAYDVACRLRHAGRKVGHYSAVPGFEGIVLVSSNFVPIEEYSSNQRRQLVLRYSLWLAHEKCCYLCGDMIRFVGTQVDHMIPRRLSKLEFSEKWAICAPDGMPNLGVHHIHNLRACCTYCNSARRKGGKELKNSLITTLLADSSKIRDKVIGIQREISADTEILDSVLRLAGFSSPSRAELLWESQISQSVLGAVFDSSAALGSNMLIDVPPTQGDCLITFKASAADFRHFAAMQLDVGASRDMVIEACVGAAQTALDLRIAAVVPGWYSGLANATTGSIDWWDVDFLVELQDLSMESGLWSLEMKVAVETVVDVPVVHQSEDGGELIEGASTLAEVDAAFVVTASARVLASQSSGIPQTQIGAEVVAGVPVVLRPVFGLPR